jgi:hypothetical protein
MKTRQVSSKRRILKVFSFTPIAKPLNGSLPSSKISHFLKLNNTRYDYINGKTRKTANAQTYLLKGLRGAVRHKIMDIARQGGIEVCHTTDKETDKHGNSLLPPGFHLLGSCQKNEECFVHQLFGSKTNEGIISFKADPITHIPEKSAVLQERLQRVHIATESRLNLTYDKKPIQDFKERYFSGDFQFEVDVTFCTRPQLGLLIETIMNLEKYGRGVNSGYGLLQVKKFQLLERQVNRIPTWKTGSFEIQEEIKEKSLKQEVYDCLEAWKNACHT